MTAFKVVTPLLHIAFSATQLHGSRVFYGLWRKQQAHLMREEDEKYLEAGTVAVPKGSSERPESV